MMKRDGASVSPCRTPAKMSNTSVSLSGVTTTALVSVYMASIALRSFNGMPYAFSLFIILFWLIESNAFLKSMIVRTADRKILHSIMFDDNE